MFRLVTEPASVVTGWFGPLVGRAKEVLSLRLLRFGLQRSIGEFLATKVRLDQIAFRDDGSFSLEDLELNVDALNRHAAAAGAPVRVVEGRVRRIHGVVPVLSILTENVEFEIDGIEIVLAAADAASAAAAAVPAASFMDDLAASMTEQFFDAVNQNQESEPVPAGPATPGQASPPRTPRVIVRADSAPNAAVGGDVASEGAEQVALLIRRVLARIKGSIRNVVIELREASPTAAAAAVLHIAALTYRDVSTETQIPQDGGEQADGDAALAAAAAATKPTAAAVDAADVAVSEARVELWGWRVSLRLPGAGSTVPVVATAAGPEAPAGDVLTMRFPRNGGRPVWDAALQPIDVLASPAHVAALAAIAAAVTRASPPPAPPAAVAAAVSTTAAALPVVSVVARGVRVALLYDDAPDAEADAAAAARHFAAAAANASSSAVLATAAQRDLLWLHAEQPRIEYDASPASSSGADPRPTVRGSLRTFSAVDVCFAAVTGTAEAHPVAWFVSPDATDGAPQQPQRTPDGMRVWPGPMPAPPGPTAGLHLPHVEVDVRLAHPLRSTTAVSVRLAPLLLDIDPTLLDRLYGHLAPTTPAGSNSSGSAGTLPLPPLPTQVIAPPELEVSCPSVRLRLRVPVPPYPPPPHPSPHPRGRPVRPASRPRAFELALADVQVSLAPVPPVKDTSAHLLRPFPGLAPDLLTLWFVHIEARELVAFVVPVTPGPARPAAFLCATASDEQRPIIVELHARGPHEPVLGSPAMDPAYPGTVASSSSSAAASQGRLFVQAAPSPFSATFVADNGVEQEAAPAATAEADRFERASLARAEMQVHVSLPVLNMHLPQAALYELYLLALDLALVVPWAPSDAPPPPGATLRRQQTPHTAAVVIAVERGRLVLEEGAAAGPDGALLAPFSATAPPPSPEVTPRLEFDLARLRLFVLSGTALPSATPASETPGVPAVWVSARAGDVLLYSRLGVHGPRELQLGRYRRTAVFAGEPDAPAEALPPMLSAAVHVAADARGVRKVTTVALGLARCRVEHHCAASGRHWIFRLLTLLDLPEPVYPGLAEPAVRLTKLSVHVRDLLLRYSPRHLTPEAVVAVHHLRMAATLVPLAPVLVLAFVFDHAGLWLAADPAALASPATHSDDPARRGYRPFFSDRRITLDIRSEAGKQLTVTLGNAELLATVHADSLHVFKDVVNYYLSDMDMLILRRDLAPAADGVPPTPAAVLPPAIVPAVNPADDAFEMALDEDAAEPASLGDSLFFSMYQPPPASNDASVPLAQSVYLDTNSAHAATEVNRGLLADALLDDDIEEDDEYSLGGQRGARGEHQPPSPRTLHAAALRWDDDHFGHTPLTRSRAGSGSFDSDTVVTPEPVRHGQVELRHPITVTHDHFARPDPRVVRDPLQAEEFFPLPTDSIIIRDVTVRLRLHDGLAFVDAASNTGPEAASTSASAPESGFIEVNARGLQVAIDMYAPGAAYDSRIVVTVDQLEVLDRVHLSVINKLLTAHFTEAAPRETDVPMVRLDWVTVRTLNSFPRPEEAIVRLALLPMHFNIDQDALTFLVEFLRFEPPALPPLAELVPVAPTFFKVVIVEAITATVDYQPKRVKYNSLFRGSVEELLGLLYLSDAHIALPRVVVRAANTMEDLALTVANEWFKSRGSHIPGIAGGLPGVRLIRNMASVATSVVQEPYSQYPRWLRGLRDGFTTGATGISAEMCSVMSTMAFALQVALESTQDVFLTRPGDAADQPPAPPPPANIQDGLVQARNVIMAALRETYGHVRGRSADGSRTKAVGGKRPSLLARLVPGAALTPLIGVCEAVSVTMQGFRNSLDADGKRLHEDKFRTKPAA